MFTIEPGQTREVWQPDRVPTHVKRVCTWRILDNAGTVIAETTTKAGALALIALLNAR